MKKIIVIIILVFNTISCKNNNSEMDKLNQKLNKVLITNNELIKHINSIDSEFMDPYLIYEEAVLNEYKRNPDSIISIYQNIIKKFPNSFWSHEAKKRIKNVEKRRTLWSKEKGWELLNVKPFKDIKTISCPGC